MNFFNRAIKSITRRKVRTIILLLIILVLSFLTSASVIVNNSVRKLSNDINSNLSKTVYVELDYAALDKDDAYDKFKRINASEMEKIGESKYVNYYDYISDGSLDADIQRVPYGDDEDEIIYNSDDRKASFSVEGTSSTIISTIREGRAKLVSGSNFTKDDIKNGAKKVLIYEELAETNNLSVGDTFNVSSVLYIYPGTWHEKSTDIDIGPQAVASSDYEVEVAGILEYTGKRFEYDESYSKSENDNRIYQHYEYIDSLSIIYTTNGFVNEINGFLSEQYALLYGVEKSFDNFPTIMFVLNDSKDIKDFTTENENILPKYSIFESELSKNEAIMGPIYKMNNIFSYLLIICCVTSIVILSLLVTLFLKERQKEMGIYLSLGISRVKVIGQIVTETLLIAIVAITLSLPFAYMASNNISKNMLNQNIEKAKDDLYMPYEGSVTIDYVEKNYNPNLSFTTILLIYLMFIVTHLLSSKIPRN